MTGCRQSFRIAARVADGGVLTDGDRRHVSGCRQCRRAVGRAETFSTLLGTAARSLVAEAASAMPVPAGGLAGQGWHAAVAIDARAFQELAQPVLSRPARVALGRLATAAAAVLTIAVLAFALLPRLSGPAASPPLDTEAVLGRIVGLGYDCVREPTPVPAAGSGPAFDCVGRSPRLSSVTITIRASTGGSLSSLVALLPGSQTPENRASVQALARELAASPFANDASAASVRAWVDRFFAPASDPGTTSLRQDGLVLRLGVIQARPYELDINPEFPR